MSILMGVNHSEEPEFSWTGAFHSGVASLVKSKLRIKCFKTLTFPKSKRYLCKVCIGPSSRKQGKSRSDDSVHSHWAFLRWVLLAQLGGNALHDYVHGLGGQHLVDRALEFGDISLL